MSKHGSIWRAAVGRSFERLEDRLALALLPDLQPLLGYLNGWTVSSLPGGGRELRYSTAVANVGAGAFEIRGTGVNVTNPDGSQSQLVNQRVFQSGGGFVDQAAGTFIYWVPHGHIHYEDFAWGRLRQRPADQSVGAVAVATPKASFALIDIQHYDPSLAGSPSSPYYMNATDAVQGISVGWNDVYGSSLEGQSIDVTGLPNGDYWLELSIDPLNHLQESDETNNVIRVPVTLDDQPPTGFRILSVSPSAALVGDLRSVTVNFNGTVDAATFTPADVSMLGPNGAVTATAVVKLSDLQYRIDFPTQTTVGTYRLVIGPNIASTDGDLLDQGNNGVGGEADDQYFNNMMITSPHLNSITPAGTLYQPVSKVRLTYNKPIAVSTLTLSDIATFTGPTGSDLKPFITAIVPAASGPSSAIFDIFFQQQSAFGNYTIVVEPTVTDPLGNSVDQNIDGATDAADRFTVTFTLSPIATVGPDPFGYSAAPVNPTAFSIAGIPGAFTIIANGDDVAAPVNLGLNTFNLYGQTFTGANQLYVSTNGLITFGAPSTEDNNDDFSKSALASIAPFWDDLLSSTVEPSLLGLFDDADADGAPERLILEWNQVWHHPGTLSTLTFQAALQLNTGPTPGAILFNYFDLDAQNTSYDYAASATVGIRAAGSAGEFVVSQDDGDTPVIRYSPAVLISVPAVQSIERLDFPTMAPGTARFSVTFSRPVSGVGTGDFQLTTTGSIAGASVTQVQATVDPAVWQVFVSTGSGFGHVRLDLRDDDSITDALGAKLGGMGAQNGSFARGAAYMVQGPQSPILVTGADAGGGPHVIVRRDLDGDGKAEAITASFFAYDASFGGGVRVATGDFDGDGLDELVTVPGPGGGPHVKIWKLNASGQVTGLIDEFFGFAGSFTGGMWVTAGDLDRDGRDELIVTADAGGGPHVRIFSDTDLDGRVGDNLIDEFFAYAPTFHGGVRVAVGNLGGNRDRLIVAAGPGGGPHVKIYDNLSLDGKVSTNPLIDEFFAFDASFTGGLFVTAGDLAGSVLDDLIVSAGSGGGPHVKVYRLNHVIDVAQPPQVGFQPRLQRTVLDSFFAYDGRYAEGVRLAISNLQPGNRADLLTAQGTGGLSLVTIWSANSATGQVSNQPKDDEFVAYSRPDGTPFPIGVFICGGRV